MVLLMMSLPGGASTVSNALLTFSGKPDCLVGDLFAAGTECAVSSFCYVQENGREGIYEV